MTKTEHYNLNQWDAGDRVLREDFNEDNRKIDEALEEKGNCRTMSGSYIGTGEYGASHPNTLELPFEPKAIFIAEKQSTSAQGYILLLSGQTICCHFNSNAGGNNSSCVWDKNTVTWYSTNSAGNQFNALNTTYFFIAFG